MSMLHPPTTCTNRPEHLLYQWLEPLATGKTYFALSLAWPSLTNFNLPAGYNLYVLNFVLEAVDIQWIQEQAGKLSAPIILFSDANYYNWNPPDNVHAYTWYTWHYQLETMKQWWPVSCDKNITHKASAHCNRVNQSKLIVFTVLAETWDNEDCIFSLSEWLADDTSPGITIENKLLDKINSIFFKKYYGQTLRYDEFSNINNYQKHNSNPWTTAYQNCAMNFTNESFYSSFMQHNNKSFIHPGPFITEKTFKCLYGATGFVPVGQFDTLGSLTKLGMKFEYGLDLSFDQIPQNFDRLEKIVNLIINLKDTSAAGLYEMTKKSAEYNQLLITSGEFYENCQKVNCKTQNIILDKFAN